MIHLNLALMGLAHDVRITDFLLCLPPLVLDVANDIVNNFTVVSNDLTYK